MLSHFLLHCSFYDNERHNYFDEILDTDEWITLSPKKTAKYLLSAFIKRRKELYK